MHRLISANILQQLTHVKNTHPGNNPQYGSVKRKRGDDELH